MATAEKPTAPSTGGREVKLVGAMADFSLQRRRRKFPPAAVQTELNSVKDQFFSPGETGKALYKILSYVLAASPLASRKKRPVRQQTLEMALATLSSWMHLETTWEDKILEEHREILRHAANFCGSYGVVPKFDGRRVVGATDQFYEHAKSRSAEIRSCAHGYIVGIMRAIVETEREFSAAKNATPPALVENPNGAELQQRLLF